MIKFVAFLYVVLRKLARRVGCILLRVSFRRLGRNVIVDPSGVFDSSNIEVGDDVYIGPHAVFLCSDSSIKIGSKVMFGPNVMLIGGDHNSGVIGSYMYDVREKRPGDDLPIVIRDDVWVGAGAIILKGVTVGEGAIIAAGSVVTRDVDDYSVVGGIPARLLKMRFSPQEVREHKALLAKEGKGG